MHMCDHVHHNGVLSQGCGDVFVCLCLRDSSNMLTGGGGKPRSHRGGPPSQGKKVATGGGGGISESTLHKKFKTSLASTSPAFQMRLQKFGCKALNGSSKLMMPVIATAVSFLKCFAVRLRTKTG